MLKNILILAGFITVITSEHLFQIKNVHYLKNGTCHPFSLLQRRAKPIRWQWSKNLAKSSDIQRRRRFLSEETMVKWWQEMTPQKDARTNELAIKDDFPISHVYFRRPQQFKFQNSDPTETFGQEIKNTSPVNRTQSLREESNLNQNRQTSFNNLPLPLQPFEKDSNAFVAENYLSPTEKTYLSGQYFQSAFGDFQSIPQQRELESEDYSLVRAKGHVIRPYPQHDIDSELLREAIIQERHKPSKFEIQSAVERLRDSDRTERHFENDGSIHQPTSSVEYVVPSVEHVEYNNSAPAESQEPPVLPIVEYVAPTVEFVEPQIEYLPDQQFNLTENPGNPIEDETPLTDEEIIVFEEETLPNESEPLENYENEDIRSEGAKFQIVGLRREQIRVRRNHRKSRQYGGEPEADYPTLEALPVVQFDCGDYLSGYYVDITTRCQVFHICHENGQRSSFLCPVGTVFNQEYLVCDWWYNVDCESSLKYYNTDYLQAYGTNNKKQRILSRPERIEENPFKNEKPPQSRLYFSEKQSKPKTESSNGRLSNLSQKAINYPVGYAILLREYMKNSKANDNIARTQSDNGNLERNKIENNGIRNKVIENDITLVNDNTARGHSASLERNENERTETNPFLIPHENNAKEHSDHNRFQWNKRVKTETRTKLFTPDEILTGDALTARGHSASLERNENERTETNPFLIPHENNAKEHSDHKRFQWNKKVKTETRTKLFAPDDISTGDADIEKNSEISSSRYPNRIQENLDESIYYGGSKPYIPLPSSRNRYSQDTSAGYHGKPETKITNHYIHKFSQPVPYENQNKSKSVLHAHLQEALPADNKETNFEKQFAKNAFASQQKEEIKNLKIPHINHSSHINAKPVGKTIKDIDKYRFIINPSEAIIPAAKQYAVLEKHLKSNNSAIKFRHAESTIKHIKPKTNKLTLKTGNVFERQTNVDHNHNLNGSLSKDRIALNSGSDVLQAVRPSPSFRYQFGDRLSKKIRSISVKNTDEFNKTSNKIRAFITENYFTLTTKTPKIFFDGISQVQNRQSKTNYTYESLPLGSESRFNFAKVNTVPSLFLNNYRAQKEKTKNKTEPFNPQIEKKKTIDDEFVTDKRKITISVRIERKEVLLQDSNKNISSAIFPGKTSNDENIYSVQRANYSSIFATNPTEYDVLNNTTNSNKTNTEGLFKDSKQTTSEIVNKNINKVSDNYGGYTIVKMINNTVASEGTRNETATTPSKD